MTNLARAYGFFGRVLDRYATDGYGPSVSTLEAIDRAGKVGGMKVLDIPARLVMTFSV